VRMKEAHQPCLQFPFSASFSPMYASQLCSSTVNNTHAALVAIAAAFTSAPMLRVLLYHGVDAVVMALERAPRRPQNRVGKDADKKRKFETEHEYSSTEYGTPDSGEWRQGPNRPKTLCNICGLRWAKKKKRTEWKGTATARSGGLCFYGEC